MSNEITRRRTSVTLMQGDDIDRLADHQQKVRIAQQAAHNAPQRRMGDEPDTSVDDAISERNAFIESAVDRAIVVEFEALGGRAFRDLVAAHPPRKDGEGVHTEDAIYRVNVDTFVYPFLAASTPDETRDEAWFEELADGDLSKCMDAAFWLNRSQVADPKGLLR